VAQHTPPVITCDPLARHTEQGKPSLWRAESPSPGSLPPSVPDVLLAGKRRRTAGNRHTSPPMDACASLRNSSPQSDLCYLGQRKRERLVRDSDRSPLAEQTLAGEGIIQLLSAQPWPLLVHRESLSQAHGEIFHPHPDRIVLWAWSVRGKI